MSSPSSGAAELSDSSSDVRFRQAFSYKDLDSDGHHRDVIYMDDQSQEQLIQELQTQDFTHNQLYCRALNFLTTSAIPYFGLRWYLRWSAGGWVLNKDLLFIVSLGMSVFSLPQVTVAKQLECPDDGRARWQIVNIVTSSLLCLWTWTKMISLGIGERPGTYEEYVCAFPFMIAVMGYCMGKMMEAVNFGELEHLRYRYKGA